MWCRLDRQMCDLCNTEAVSLCLSWSEQHTETDFLLNHSQYWCLPTNNNECFSSLSSDIRSLSSQSLVWSLKLNISHGWVSSDIMLYTRRGRVHPKIPSCCSNPASCSLSCETQREKLGNMSLGSKIRMVIYTANAKKIYFELYLRHMIALYCTNNFPIGCISHTSFTLVQLKKIILTTVWLQNSLEIV